MASENGYQPTFIGKNLKVDLPVLGSEKHHEPAPVKGEEKALLTYPHFSVALSKLRKLPLYAAVNIDGKKFQEITRTDLFGGSDRWSVDPRAGEYQWGNDLYSASGSEFDKGHMVKREDPQWGENLDQATEAARSTFYFSNCAPQVGDLNRKEWRSLEDYILKKESSQNKLKINVFTGPVLSENDPVFVTPVKGEQVPDTDPVLESCLFYKRRPDPQQGRLSDGTKKLLFKNNIVREKEEELEAVVVKPKLFDDYDDAATYQVNINLIEQLTGLTFSHAKDPYKDSRSVKMVLKQVELESFGPNSIDFDLEGIVLS
ncbi:MAG: DNA/RNA non-specific endonuclease [Lewinellaceae bacterium]|nr:DNA/RNA non-specific endonuclease [Lewinellaceae bacterium]